MKDDKLTKDMNDFWNRYDRVLEKYPDISSNEWLVEYKRTMKGNKIYEDVCSQSEEQLYESAMAVTQKYIR